MSNTHSSYEFQGRFLAYAAAKGAQPENLPSGYAFISWLNAKWDKFCRDFSRNPDFHTDRDHADFDAWLPKEAARERLDSATGSAA